MSFEYQMKDFDTKLNRKRFLFIVISLSFLCFWGSYAEFEVGDSISGEVYYSAEPFIVKTSSDVTIRDVLVNDGDWVNKGDVIFKGCYYNDSSSCVEVDYRVDNSGYIYSYSLIKSGESYKAEEPIFYMFEKDMELRVKAVISPELAIKLPVGASVKITASSDIDNIEIVTYGVVKTKSRRVTSSLSGKGYESVIKVLDVEEFLYEGMPVTIFVSGGKFSPLAIIYNSLIKSINKSWINHVRP
ncbi:MULTISPECIES: hypothetical protein [Pseudoalteromonas]|uniref:Uncharacterized protein n=1 Tax=Pseudoalteromonas amylolytica TaxID=1859457 RepID=A0A1S1MMR2_9GAMM|nr:MULTISPECIES: hypothetical protein [Pseudoalteromonas]OHU86201.1 hypothetical protein BFC16_15980 [Pseudoalteromonas sp. JW3]OHU89693.1 hypothetical protein BET10_16340 [Pseudoalteromonas amylolytica]